MPPSHPMRANFTAHHLVLLKNCVLSRNLMSEVQGATKETIRLRDHVPIGHAKWHFSGLCVGNMLARRYILSHQIRDLMEVMKHAIETCREFDNLQQRNGIRRKIDISPLCELSPWLSKINNVPFDTPATRQAQEKVYR